MGTLARSLAVEAPLFHSVSPWSLGVHLQRCGCVAGTPSPHHTISLLLGVPDPWKPLSLRCVCIAPLPSLSQSQPAQGSVLSSL